MRILITGAAGFIGSHLAEYLTKKGHEVFGIDNFNDYYDPALKEMNALAVRDAGGEVLSLDLCESLTAKLPPQLDHIFHLAAQPGIAATVPLRDYVRNNIFATQNLVDTVLDEQSDLRLFANIATSSIYGKEATLPETAVPAPISFYGTTKLAAEQLVMGAQRTGKLSACSLRLYSVYGPRERPEKLYTKLIKAIRENTPFPLYEGSEHHVRSFTYVEDIVTGIASVIGREKVVDGEIINLGSDKEYSTAHGIALVEGIMGEKAIVATSPPRPGDQLKTTAIIDKAIKLLDYRLTTTFKKGLRQQIAWYDTNF